MGRVAAIVWAVAGLWVILAGLFEIPGRLADLERGWAIRDSRTLLMGSAVAIAMGLLALAGSVRGWRARSSAWFAAPAVVLATGSVWGGILLGFDAIFGSVVMLSTLYGIYVLPPVALVGLAIVGVVVLVDRWIERAVARPAISD